MIVVKKTDYEYGSKNKTDSLIGPFEDEITAVNTAIGICENKMYDLNHDYAYEHAGDEVTPFEFFDDEVTTFDGVTHDVTAAVAFNDDGDYRLVMECNVTEVFHYLVDLTFYAGSDDPEDTDHEMYIFQMPKAFTEEAMQKAFEKAVKRLNGDEGYNIETLVFYFCKITKGQILDNVHLIDAIYNIEQWQ